MLTPGAYDPRFMKPATLCRCGHILECCADCRDWLVNESPRIADSWAWCCYRWFGDPARGWFRAWSVDAIDANAAEADNLAYYLSQR